ncbi:hypothetical protein BS78_09G062400 [Paspalum vaginatum]|nr:hypothetical protein BS78_09G062400 [Paspalum vaginatum]
MKKWPCDSYPPFRCKCGILAWRGVVPSELGKGWYCGYSYGDFWEGRGCVWEYFLDQEDWFEEMVAYGAWRVVRLVQCGSAGKPG